MKTIVRIISEFYCGISDLEAVRELAEDLVAKDPECPPETYELLNPGSKVTGNNLYVVAEYLGYKDIESTREFDVAVANIVVESLKEALLNKNKDLSKLQRLVIYLSNNFEPNVSADWLNKLYNDFDMYGELWDDPCSILEDIPSRISEIEKWSKA